MCNGAIHFLPPASSRSGCLERRTGSSLCSSTKISPVMDQGLDGHSMDCDMESSTSSNVHRLSASMHKATASSLRSSDLAPLRKSQKRPTGPSPLVRLPKNRAYCSKLDTRIEGTEPIEFGELELATERGKSSSTKEAVFRIRSDPDFTVSNFIELFPEVWVRYPDLIARVRLSPIISSGNEIFESSLFTETRDWKKHFCLLNDTQELIGNLLENGGMVIADKKLLCSMILTALGSVALNFCESLTPSQLQWKLKGLSLTYQPPTSSSRPTTSQNPGTANTFVAFPDHKTAVERRINVVIQYRKIRDFLRNGWSDLLRPPSNFGIVTGYENETISFHTPRR